MERKRFCAVWKATQEATGALNRVDVRKIVIYFYGLANSLRIFATVFKAERQHRWFAK